MNKADKKQNRQHLFYKLYHEKRVNCFYTCFFIPLLKSVYFEKDIITFNLNRLEMVVLPNLAYQTHNTLITSNICLQCHTPLTFTNFWRFPPIFSPLHPSCNSLLCSLTFLFLGYGWFHWLLPHHQPVFCFQAATRVSVHHSPVSLHVHTNARCSSVKCLFSKQSVCLCVSLCECVCEREREIKVPTYFLLTKTLTCTEQCVFERFFSLGSGPTDVPFTTFQALWEDIFYLDNTNVYNIYSISKPIS